MGSINDFEKRWSSYKPGDKVTYKSYGELKIGTVTSVGDSVKIRDTMTDRVQSVPFSKVAGRFNS